MATYIANTRIRAAAESIQDGLQLARAEAIKNNIRMRFKLTDASGKIAWTVECALDEDDCPDDINSRSKSENEGGGNARVGVTTDADISDMSAIAAGTNLPAVVTFNNLGRVVDGPGNAITRADITDANNADTRWLAVTISVGGQIRMCNPALNERDPPDPRGCL